MCIVLPRDCRIRGKGKVIVAGVVAVRKLIVFRQWGANHHVPIVKISIGTIECGIT